MDINKETEWVDPVVEYYYSLQPKKCVGCECSELVYDRKKGMVWVCELEEKGEPCYMGNESYNPEWSIDDT